MRQRRARVACGREELRHPRRRVLGSAQAGLVLERPAARMPVKATLFPEPGHRRHDRRIRKVTATADHCMYFTRDEPPLVIPQHVEDHGLEFTPTQRPLSCAHGRDRRLRVSRAQTEPTEITIR